LTATDPNVQLSGLAKALLTAIQRPETIRIGVVSGDPDVLMGQYISGRIDIQDIVAAGSGPGAGGGALIAHEVIEQTAKQVFGLQNTPEGYALAHQFGIAAQDDASGYQRGARYLLPGFNLSTGTGTMTTQQTRNRQTITVTMQWVNGNLVRVER